MTSTLQTIRSTEAVEVMGLRFHALVDTGADYCALYCNELSVRGNYFSALVRNERGKGVRINNQRCTFTDMCSFAGVQRYVLTLLPVRCHAVEKHVPVVLTTTRFNTSYRFLLGRNFIAGDFLVNVQ